MMAGGKSTSSKCLVLMAFLLYSFTLVLSQPADTQPANPTDMSEAVHMNVDQSGNGDYNTLQAAIDAVPSNNAQTVYIWVKPGTYSEKVTVPADKPFITITGTAGPDETIIRWNQCGGIYEAGTFSVLASDFIAQSLTIQNACGKRTWAVALRVSGDKAAFYNCKILSHQDTLFEDGGRHYYSNCYIEGDTDFIFGDATSLYQGCHLHSLSGYYGAITAQRRMSPEETSGFTFLGCKITGVAKAVLGRPWGPYARVIFAYTHMTNVIQPEGWDSWGLSRDKLSNVYYAQYKCFGAGADASKRVDWAHEITDIKEVVPFLTRDFIGGREWLRPAPTQFNG